MPRIRHIGGIGSILTAGKSGATGDAPDFVDAQTATASSTTALTVNKPGVSVGDILIARIVSSGVSSHIPPDAKWGRIGGYIETSRPSTELFLKIVDGTEDSTFVFSPTVSNTRSIILAAYRPKKALDLQLDQLPLPVYSAASTAFSTVSLTPKRKSRMLVFVGYNNASPNATAPSGTTQRAMASASTSKQYLFDVLAPKGTAISKAGTLSSANQHITEALLF
ncbi:hypothetical protein GB927_007715 [Shinella sp. CPCC 100929]|uniref:Uncharacterized protein n=1 Tax=Shinella lacus TaxID=2654216 RepID=A0ABT1R4D5_9HYPH|nr:hypothetical protein [Shinella lacus]MCQ4629914.1 hypothetical protein [Shinella lacus]